MATLRVLVVDDYEPFRNVARLILQLRNDVQIVGEASDGLEAVQKAKGLQPDIILLDIALPTLNGIQVARRVRDLIPSAKVLFVSVESSPDVVQQALGAGGAGYISKLNVGSELLPAIDVVLTGKKFVGSGFEVVAQSPPQRHEMAIYSEDAVLLERLHAFVAAALRVNSAAIVVATKPHRDSLVQRLQDDGFDVDTATQRGTFISLDVVEMLSTFLVNGSPDRSLFLEGFRTLIGSAAKAANNPRVVIFGDCCGLLYADGNIDAAISIEKMANELCKMHDVDILCGYSSLHGQEDDSVFKTICAEHSAVHSR